ncbi:MAG TPA: hypothetical protein VI316_08875 [Candidatus Dormibacteraeota bacterium]
MTATLAPAIVGHAATITRLHELAAERRLSHATMLSGPDGVGKTTVAEALATALLDADRWPGGLRAHPDHWLEDSDAERVGIARVRAGGGDDVSGPSLQDFFSRAPYAGALRVAVVGRADRLTEQAANCVLKTLEEPPAQTHILLCAAHPERLPATILSRCQALALAPVPAAEISGWLAGAHGVESTLATTAAALSAGRPGRALALATEPGALAVELGALEVLLGAGGGGRSAALRAAGGLAPPNTAEGRERALAQVSAFTAFLRDVAAIGAGAPELVLFTHYGAAAARWAETLPPERVTHLLGRCVVTADQLAQYAVPRLAYEVLFLDIIAGEPPPPRVLPPPRPAGLLDGDGPSLPTTLRRRPQRRR